MRFFISKLSPDIQIFVINGHTVNNTVEGKFNNSIGDCLDQLVIVEAK